MTGLVGSAVIGFLILTATVSRDVATSNVASWSGPLFLLGLLLLVVPMIIASIRLYRRLMNRLAQTVPAAPPADAWAHRKRLEISVIANVSAGREPNARPIVGDPENSRLRELKDAISDGELDAELNGRRANVRSTVTLQGFTIYVAATNKPHWIELLYRWQKVQAPLESELSNELKEKRIPLLRFLEIAKQHGWDMLSPGGYEAFDLIHGITEAAGLGDLVMLGKKLDRQLPAFTATGRLQVIPNKLWQTHVIEPQSCLIFTNPGNVVGFEDENLKTHTRCEQGNPLAFQDYADLHLQTEGLLDWLDNDAKHYRGHTQKAYGD